VIYRMLHLLLDEEDEEDDFLDPTTASSCRLLPRIFRIWYGFGGWRTT